MKDLTGKTYEEIISIIAEKCKSFGAGTAEHTTKFVEAMVENYSKVLGMDKLEVLRTIETNRDYSAPNYYQEANFPKLDSSQVMIFKNKEEFFERFPSHQFVCPACEGISTDPYECNSGEFMDKKEKKICNWKAYGLFGTLGKGIQILFRDNFFECPKPSSIFKPIELVEEKEVKVG